MKDSDMKDLANQAELQDLAGDIEDLLKRLRRKLTKAEAALCSLSDTEPAARAALPSVKSALAGAIAVESDVLAATSHFPEITLNFGGK